MNHLCHTIHQRKVNVNVTIKILLTVVMHLVKQAPSLVRLLACQLRKQIFQINVM